MVGDYRTGRSYVMFNYNKFEYWYWLYSAQGYRVQTSYLRLFTSYSSLSSQLPILIGNTGKDREIGCCIETGSATFCVILKNVFPIQHCALTVIVLEIFYRVIL